MVRVVVLLVLLITGVRAAVGAGAMDAQSTVRIDWCVGSGPLVAPAQL